MTARELEDRYEELLKSEVKLLPQKILTLFDVAGFPHYESVMSNFYAFYLNPNEKHGVGDLFISALTDIIGRKTNGRLIISDPKICLTDREIFTENGKYIDIVVRELSENTNEVDNAIIIENKVNATVYNDLMEYFNSIQVNKNKIGIVLSLRPELNLPSEYINITHEEYISQIEQSPATYFLGADLKQMVILKEFIQNIKSMTSRNDLKEQYDFFFKHQEKVKEISIFYENIRTDIYRQADDVCEKLNLGLKLQARYSTQLRYYASESTPVYFTVWLYDLLSGDGSIHIYIELNEAGIANLETIKKIDFTAEERKLFDETSKVRKSYIHFATLKAKPTPEEVKYFTNYIYELIVKSPLKEMFVKIENCLQNIDSVNFR